jgi:hypothetical protein
MVIFNVAEYPAIFSIRNPAGYPASQIRFPAGYRISGASLITRYSNQCFGSGSTFDGLLYPDPEKRKSAKTRRKIKSEDQKFFKNKNSYFLCSHMLGKELRKIRRKNI